MKVFGMAVALASLAGALLTTGVLAADNSQDVAKTDRVSKDCVQVHAAGRGGKIQVRGGGVHLVVEAEEASDREASDLQALAVTIANKVCGNAAAEEADAVTAADALQGAEVLHHNTYGAED